MRLKIRYRSGDDDVTERIISDVVVDPPKMIHAFCHMRNANRSFVINRIESATDLDTGELIDDVGNFFGLDTTRPKKLSLPKFSETPTSLSLEKAQRQRKEDKINLFKPFKTPAIAELARRKLFDLFHSRCFRCGNTLDLEFDHHIPQHLGGRLIPGNVVVLCSRCNAIKRDRHPDQFYALRQLQAIEALLKEQLKIFEFEFDWVRWNGHCDQYLLSLGASPEFVQEVMTDRESPFFAGQRESAHGITITISAADMMRALADR